MHGWHMLKQLQLRLLNPHVSSSPVQEQHCSCVVLRWTLQLCKLSFLGKLFVHSSPWRARSAVGGWLLWRYGSSWPAPPAEPRSDWPSCCPGQWWARPIGSPLQWHHQPPANVRRETREEAFFFFSYFKLRTFKCTFYWVARAGLSVGPAREDKWVLFFFS